MESLKFSVISIIILVLFVLGGYWAIVTMQSGSEHVNTQKIKALENENEDLKNEVEQLKVSLSTIQEVKTPAPQNTTPTERPKTPVPKPTTTTPKTYKNQSLINALQKLVDGNISLKLKSTGPAVGTVQKFLNVYNKTSNKVDNDFGASMEKAIKAFQKTQGLSQDGEVGAGTLKKMIDWLKKQG